MPAAISTVRGRPAVASRSGMLYTDAAVNAYATNLNQCILKIKLLIAAGLSCGRTCCGDLDNVVTHGKTLYTRESRPSR